MKKKTTTPHDDMMQEQFNDITNALTDVFSEKFGEALERGDFKDYKPGDEITQDDLDYSERFAKTLASGGIVKFSDADEFSIAPEGGEFIVPLSAINEFAENDEMVDRVITDLQSKFSEAMANSVSEQIINLKPPDTPILEAGDGYEIIMPEMSQHTPIIITNPYSDIQEVHFGKMPLSEVFAKQLAKKRIRAIEKAKAKTKRRKANKAAKKSRKK